MTSSIDLGFPGLDVRLRAISSENIWTLFSAVGLIIAITYRFNVVLPELRLKRKLSRYPVINKERGEWSSTKALQRVAQNLKAVLQEGTKKVTRLQKFKRGRKKEAIVDKRISTMAHSRSWAPLGRDLSSPLPQLMPSKTTPDLPQKRSWRKQWPLCQDLKACVPQRLSSSLYATT